jgi:hypothetical protein
VNGWLMIVRFCRNPEEISSVRWLGHGNRTLLEEMMEALNRSSAGNQIHNQHEQSNHEQQMDQRASNMESPS